MITTYGLGIDAGGTYTDAVIIDFSNKQVVVKSKAPTTQPDPSGGIRVTLDQIDTAFLTNISMVSLATTFATNAIVEDRGAEAGLILVGYGERPSDIPRSARVLMINGGHTVSGEQRNPLDEIAAESDLQSFCKELDAVAVAAFFSVRNPEHEIRIAKIIRDKHNLPVVQGHQLSSRLDAFKRATTAWWNARLIPLISNLVKATENILSEKGINAPLMVVRGDGTLMSAKTALDRPVDTLLSGPAASILGAKHLSGLTDALIVDVGGTTTDMALLSGGKVEIDPQGASVGKWRTHVEAAKVRTVGVGGDSLIALTPERNLKVGPRRVVPLCVMAERHPEILKMLKEILNDPDKASYGNINPCSFYFRTGSQKGVGEVSSHDNFSSGLLNEYLQFKNTRNWFSAREMEHQELKGMVYRSSLTPTDIWVANGHFELGSRDAGQLALAVFARHMGVSKTDLAQAVEDEISRRLCLEAISLVGNKNDAALMHLLNRWFHPPVSPCNNVDLDVKVTLTGPVIGLGAPAAQCLPKTFDRLHCKCVLPDAYEVAVAVGAVVGIADCTITALIRSNESGRFILYTEEGREEFRSKQEAMENGKFRIEAFARKRMQQDKVAEPLIEYSVEEKSVKTRGGDDIHLETILRLRATGRPNVCRQS